MYLLFLKYVVWNYIKLAGICDIKIVPNRIANESVTTFEQTFSV